MLLRKENAKPNNVFPLEHMLLNDVFLFLTFLFLFFLSVLQEMRSGDYWERKSVPLVLHIWATALVTAQLCDQTSTGRSPATLFVTGEYAESRSHKVQIHVNSQMFCLFIFLRRVGAVRAEYH